VCQCSASHFFLRSSGLTLSGHEPPKTSLILLNMGRTRPKVPLPAGKSRFFGVSSAGSVLLVCVPVNLDKSWYRPNCLPLQRTTVDTSPPGGGHRSLMPSHQLRAYMPAVQCFIFWDFYASPSKLGSSRYPPMPVSDIGRKDRRVVKAIALLLQRRDSRCWHTFDVGTSRT